jgi:cellulase
MDIWEANAAATVLTPHTCNAAGSFGCIGETECGPNTGVCDKNGCGINPFREGSKNYYGEGFTVDTTKPFTVVTQFISSDGTDNGVLSEIRRLYIQEGKVIPNADVASTDEFVAPTADLAPAGGAISQDFCTAQNASDFNRLGGLKGMGESLARGMVLIFSIWNSDGDFMNWLDTENNGPCSLTEGDPKLILEKNPEVAVTFSNIKWGEIGSTFSMTNLEAPDSLVNAATTSAALRTRIAPTGGVLALTAALAYLLL